MSCPKFFIHIGYPKTATTSLQHYVFPSLRDQGCNYYGETAGEGESVAIDFVDYVHQSRTNLIHHLHTDGSLLISAESVLSRCIKDLDSHGKFLVRQVSGLANRCYEAAKDHSDACPKAIIVFRNQVELMHSSYCQSYSHYFSKEKKINSFEKYVDHVLSQPLLSSVYEFDQIYSDFLKAFGGDGVFCGFYEHLEQNPLMFLASLQKFLGYTLPDSIPRDNVHRSVTGDRVTRARGVYSALLDVKRRFFPHADFGIAHKLNWLERFVIQRPVVIPRSEPYEKLIRERYRSHNIRLSSLVGTDLSDFGYY